MEISDLLLTEDNARKRNFTCLESVQVFPRQKGFYGFCMDFCRKQENLCQKCTRFFRREMFLDCTCQSYPIR